MDVDRSLLGEPHPIFVDRPPAEGFISVPEAAVFFGRSRYGEAWPEPAFAWHRLWGRLKEGDPYEQAGALQVVEGIPVGRAVVPCLWHAFDQVVCALCWEEVRTIVCRYHSDSSALSIVEKKEVAFHCWCAVFEPPELLYLPLLPRRYHRRRRLLRHRGRVRQCLHLR